MHILHYNTANATTYYLQGQILVIALEAALPYIQRTQQFTVHKLKLVNQVNFSDCYKLPLMRIKYSFDFVHQNKPRPVHFELLTVVYS